MLEYLTLKDSQASILPLFQEGTRKDSKDRGCVEESVEERRRYLPLGAQRYSN